MATAVQSAVPWRQSFAWLRQFLRDELAPYPGRGAVVARMVIGTTLVMIICMTFGIPYAFQGAIFVLLVSRESLHATLQSAATILVATAIGAAYLLLTVGFLVSDPLLHLFWVIGSLFLAFYAMSVLTSYFAAVIFAVIISVGVPLWDRLLPAENNVEDTLRLCLAALVAIMVTAGVEVIFAALKPQDDLTVSIADRLESVANLLRSYVEGKPDRLSQQKIISLSLVGMSRMRRDLEHSNYSVPYAEKMGAVVAFTGRLVDVAATLSDFPVQLSDDDRSYLRSLTESIVAIRNDLLAGRPPHLASSPQEAKPVETVPLLREIGQTVTLIAEVFTGSQSLHAFARSSEPAEPRMQIFAPDTFSNPDHIRFCLRGGLTASLCYVIYHLVAWPGISTAITTCLLTALTTVGSSRQKQVLRFGGAFVGGVIIGIGAQAFILPALDSITGFTLLFVAVTFLAAWFATSSPRLSYFGIQIALAFYLINLQEFKFQTSLSVARDRVAGILLGLIAMWLVFDQLWGAPAAVAMKRAFITTVRLLAQLFREPISSDHAVAVQQSYALRESIGVSLNRLREQADAVMLEFGSARERDLALRAQLFQWQLRLRSVFVARIALLKYRLRLRGFELPETIQAAQHEFDMSLATLLDGLADRLEGKPAPRPPSIEAALQHLEQEVRLYYPTEPPEHLPEQLRTFLPLTRRVCLLLQSVADEVLATPLP